MGDKTCRKPLAIVWIADGEVAPGLDYGVRLEEHLRERGLNVVRRTNLTTDSEVPDADHHILTGGATSTTSTSGWMVAALGRLQTMLTRAGEGRCTVTGVCLGAQMIAEASCPGSVRRGSSIEVGFAEILWSGPTAEQSIVVPAFHYEEIMPACIRTAGGTVRASNQHSAVQAFDIGPRVRGFQFHPELTPTDVQQLIAAHRDTIRAHGGSVADAEDSLTRLEALWSRQLFDALFDHLDQ